MQATRKTAFRPNEDDLYEMCLSALRRAWLCPFSKPLETEGSLDSLSQGKEPQAFEHLRSWFNCRPSHLPWLISLLGNRLRGWQRDRLYTRMGDEDDRLRRDPGRLGLSSTETRALAMELAQRDSQREYGDIHKHLLEIADSKERQEQRPLLSETDTRNGFMPDLLTINEQGGRNVIFASPLYQIPDGRIGKLYSDWQKRTTSEFRKSWQTVERLIGRDLGGEIPFLVLPLAGLIEMVIDGGSIGLAHWFTLWLKMQNRSLPFPVAMTGRVGNDGSVAAVGSIRDKILVALQKDYRFVFIPEENRKDCADLLQNRRVRTVSQIRDLQDWYHLSDPLARATREIETIHLGNRSPRHLNRIPEPEVWLRRVLASGAWETQWDRSRKLITGRRRGGRPTAWVTWLTFLRARLQDLSDDLAPNADPRLWCEWVAASVPEAVGTAFLPLLMSWFLDHREGSFDSIYYRLLDRIFDHDSDHQLAMRLGKPVFERGEKGVWANGDFRRRFPLLLWSQLNEPIKAVDVLLSLPHPLPEERQWLDHFLQALDSKGFSPETYAASSVDHRSRFRRQVRSLLRDVIRNVMPEWVPTFTEQVSFDERIALLWRCRYRMRKARHPLFRVLDEHLHAHCRAGQSDAHGVVKAPLNQFPAIRAMLGAPAPHRKRIDELVRAINTTRKESGRNTLERLEKAMEAESRRHAKSGAKSVVEGNEAGMEPGKPSKEASSSRSPLGLGLHRIPPAIKEPGNRWAVLSAISFGTRRSLFGEMRPETDESSRSGVGDKLGQRGPPPLDEIAASEWAFLCNPALEMARGLLRCHRAGPVPPAAFDRWYKRLLEWSQIQGELPGTALNHGILYHWLGRLLGAFGFPPPGAESRPRFVLPLLAGYLFERPDAGENVGHLVEQAERLLPKMTWRECLWLRCFSPAVFSGWKGGLRKLVENQTVKLAGLRASSADRQADQAVTLALISWTRWSEALDDAKLEAACRTEARAFEEEFATPETNRTIIQAILPLLKLWNQEPSRLLPSFARLIDRLGRNAGFPLLACAYFSALRPWEACRRPGTPFQKPFSDRLWSSGYERTLFQTILIVERRLRGERNLLRRDLLTSVFDLPNSFFGLELLG